MPIMNDVFNQDAFNFINLTAAVNELPFVESAIGDIGIFNGITEGLETDTVVIDITKGVIKILQTSERGAPPQRSEKKPLASSRTVRVPHIEEEDRIMAASLFGKRKPGTSLLENVADKVNDGFQQMMNFEIAPTYEIHRLGALRGLILDADGSTIEDLFALFSVVQQTQNYVLSSSTTDVRDTTTKALRLIRNSLDGVPFSGARVLCGKDFYDLLTKHPSVRETFLNFSDAQDLRVGLLGTPFPFGGVLWEEYRGMDIPNQAGLGTIADDEAIMFPLGVPGMFRTYWAPGDFLETVNQLGQQFYAKIAPDFKYNRWVDQLIETNTLFINTRPRSVLKITSS